MAELAKAHRSMHGYRIIRRLGRGGMAEVFLVRAEPAGVHAVLKRVLPHFADDARFIDMFRDEMAIASRLVHPSICRVFRASVEDGRHFYTMEYVHGDDLGLVLARAADRGTRLPIAASVHILHCLATALHVAHEARDDDDVPLEIVHRDVNPSNVMLAYDGQVKLLDFGIARARQRRARTTIGGIKGKISYMSPEQCRGKPVDRRADVFSLGVLCYELFTGRELFDGETEVATLNRIVNEDVVPPSTVLPTIPPQLDALTLRALRRRADERFATAAELAHALQQFASSAGLAPTSQDVRKALAELLGDRVHRHPEASVDRGDDNATTIERRAFSTTSRAHDPTPAPPVVATTAAPEPSRRLSPLWIAGILGVAAIGWLVGRHGAAPTAEPNPVAAAESVDAGAPPLFVPPDASGPGASTVPIRVTVTPAHARLELDGASIDGPLLTLPRSKRRHSLVVSAPGYRNAKRRFVPSGPRTLRIALEPVPRRRRSKRPAEPRPDSAQPSRPAIEREW